MKPRKKKNSLFLRAIKIGLLFLLWVLIVGVIIFLAAFIYYAPQIPDPESIINRRISQSTKIYDSTGKVLLYDIFGEERRTIIPPEQIPNTIKQAIVVAEDANFYKHHGLDIKGIIRAFIANIRAKNIVQGGSTITQQLVKNSLLGNEKTFSRKFKEAILALQIERKFTKDEILWMYLNQITFGSNIFGIESAARNFFGKPAKDLNYNEASALAALIKAATYYSPYGSHKDKLIERKNFILDRLAEYGYISKEEAEKYKKEKLEFKANRTKMLAPHFVVMVREFLASRYGEDFIKTAGLKVYTTLDWDLQQKAEEIIKKYAERNERLFKAGNAALVAIDPKTGNLLAMVGSRDYFDIEKEGNFNVATALRQPGSAFKPIVYSVALDKGLTDKTILFDVKTEFNPNCPPDASKEKDNFGNKCYHPQNADERYRGPITLRQALGNSLNVPSVKVLYIAGIDNSIKRAKELGITSLNNPSRFGLSLILGGAEVSLLELTGAYGAFANDGIFNPVKFINRIKTSDGKVFEDFNTEPQRKLSKQTARMINDILSDNLARSFIFGLRSPLYFPDRQVAVKTGTTQNFRDAWTIGYTPSLVAGVWVGNNDNTEMTEQGGGVAAGAPIWHEFMEEALKDKEKEFFPKPEPVSSNKIMLNGNYINENGEIHNILHYINPNDVTGPIPDNPEKDPQYKNWEWTVQNRFKKEPAINN